MVCTGIILLLCLLLAGVLWRMAYVLRREATADQRLMATIDSADAGLAVWDASRRLTVCNDRFREFYPSVTLKPGLEFEDLVRFTVTRAVVIVPESEIEAWIGTWLDRFGQVAHEIVRTPDDRWIEVRTSPTDSGETLLIFTDVTAARMTAAADSTRHERLAEQSANLDMLRHAVAIGRKSTSFHLAARGMLELVAVWGRWQAGTVYLIASDGVAHLTSTGVWFVSDDEGVMSPEVRREIDGCAEDPDDVLRQTVSAKRPVWIGNLSVDPRLSDARRRALVPIRSLCAFPIVSEDRVVGVVEWYSCEAKTPDETREALMLDAIGQLSQVFVRERASRLTETATDRGI